MMKNWGAGRYVDIAMYSAIAVVLAVLTWAFQVEMKNKERAAEERSAECSACKRRQCPEGLTPRLMYYGGEGCICVVLPSD